MGFYALTSATGPAYGALFIFFVAFSQVALLNILTAIFVNNAMELAKPEQDIQAVEHWKKEIEAYEELCVLCKSIDADGSGYISVEEFQNQIRNGKLGAHLSMLGLDISDAAYFFDLVMSCVGDDGSEEVRIPDFVEGCMRMRGRATGIELQSLHQQTHLLFKSLLEFQQETANRFRQLRSVIQCLDTDEVI